MGMSAAHCQGNVRELQSVWRVVTLSTRQTVCLVLGYCQLADSSVIWAVKVSPSHCFWFTVAAWSQHAVSNSAPLSVCLPLCLSVCLPVSLFSLCIVGGLQQSVDLTDSVRSGGSHAVCISTVNSVAVNLIFCTWSSITVNQSEL